MHAATDVLGEFFCIRPGCLAKTPHQQLGVTANGAQRFLEIVGRDIGELFEVGVGTFELLRLGL